jgi:hypothetical protein
VENEYTQNVSPFDAAAHPRAIRDWYENRSAPKAEGPKVAPDVTLGVLMGPGERENLTSFFWQFRDWPGELVVLDDTMAGGDAQILEKILQEILRLRKDRYQIIRSPLGGDFGAARNRIQEAARSPWVLMSDMDERWSESLLRGVKSLIEQLERDRKLICGFPRANFIDGVLVNDVPSKEWTPEGLMSALPRTSWPPRNADVQYRLVRKEETWSGKIHEAPCRLNTHTGQVVVLRDFWILHDKSYARQQNQDGFYKSLGQREGMPTPHAPRVPAGNLRESTIRKVMDRLPSGRLVVVETGTLRDASLEARQGDGWSTVVLAECLAKRNDPGSRLYSIDINPEFIDVSKSAVDLDLHPWVRWVCSDAVEAIRTLPVKAIDLLYLDSSDDPREILAEFEEAEPKLAPHSIVVVDDTGPYHAGPFGKGTLLIPEAQKRGWKADRIDDARYHMAILTRQTEPQAREDYWRIPMGSSDRGR